MLSRERLIAVAVFLPALGLVLANCGGPTSPSGPNAVVLHGTVFDETAAVSAQSVGAASATAAGEVVVTVREDDSISTTVAKDGTFMLTGLPTGTIHLDFVRNGRLLGSVTIEDVAAGEELDVKVKVQGNGVALVDLQRSSPGPSPSPSASPSPSPSPSATPTPGAACLINGGRVGDGIELEGSVTDGTGTSGSFTLQVQGNRSSGPVAVNAGGADFQCHPASGPNAPTPAACKANVSPGAKVHVSGTLDACDSASAAVSASKVIVQQAGN